MRECRRAGIREIKVKSVRHGEIAFAVRIVFGKAQSHLRASLDLHGNGFRTEHAVFARAHVEERDGQGREFDGSCLARADAPRKDAGGAVDA